MNDLQLRIVLSGIFLGGLIVLFCLSYIWHVVEQARIY